jgi:hypothetical protein
MTYAKLQRRRSMHGGDDSASEEGEKGTRSGVLQGNKVMLVNVELAAHPGLMHDHGT